MSFGEMEIPILQKNLLRGMSKIIEDHRHPPLSGLKNHYYYSYLPISRNTTGLPDREANARKQDSTQPFQEYF